MGIKFHLLERKIFHILFRFLLFFVFKQCSLILFLKIILYFLFFSRFSFIYLFMAALGLHCCAWAFSSCGEQGLLFIAVHGLLIAAASLVAEHGL